MSASTRPELGSTLLYDFPSAPNGEAFDPSRPRKFTRKRTCFPLCGGSLLSWLELSFACAMLLVAGNLSSVFAYREAFRNIYSLRRVWPIVAVMSISLGIAAPAGLIVDRCGTRAGAGIGAILSIVGYVGLFMCSFFKDDHVMGNQYIIMGFMVFAAQGCTFAYMSALLRFKAFDSKYWGCLVGALNGTFVLSGVIVNCAFGLVSQHTDVDKRRVDVLLISAGGIQVVFSVLGIFMREPKREVFEADDDEIHIPVGSPARIPATLLASDEYTALVAEDPYFNLRIHEGKLVPHSVSATDVHKELYKKYERRAKAAMSMGKSTMMARQALLQEKKGIPAIEGGEPKVIRPRKEEAQEDYTRDSGASGLCSSLMKIDLWTLLAVVTVIAVTSKAFALHKHGMIAASRLDSNHNYYLNLLVLGAGVVGCFVTGTVSDLVVEGVRRGYVLFFATLLNLTSSLLMLFCFGDGIWVLYAGASLVGVSFGAVWSVAPVMIAEKFGKFNVGFLWGLMLVASTLTYLGVQVFMHWVYSKHSDHTSHVCVGIGCYHDSFILLTCLSAVGPLGAIVLLFRSL